jgi:hypothetical protein
MGARVGLQCFQSSEIATDYVVSQIVPVLHSEGYLIAPRKQGKDWFVGSEKIVLNFPECSILDQFSYGSKIATPFVLVFVIIFFFRIVARFISSSGVSDGQ